jgi:hypothetical protein
MTTLGKVLAFLNIVGAVGILTWAVSAHANRVDYLDRKSGTETVKGQISQMRSEIDAISKAISESQTAYGTRMAAVTSNESYRDYRKSKFQERLAQARKGVFRVQLPAGDPVFTDLDKEGPIVLGPDNQPLRGIVNTQADLDAEVRAAEVLIRGAQPLPEAEWQKVPELIKDPQQFATLLENKGIGDLRRLHGILSDDIARTDEATQRQQVIAANLRDEARFLSDYRVNWSAELQTLERRQKQLRGRLTELGVTPEGK